MSYKQQGVALAVATIFVLVMNLLVVGNMHKSFMQEKMAYNQKIAIQAEMAAEAAMHDAIEKLKSGTISDLGNESNVNWSYSGSLSGLSNNVTGSYLISHKINPSNAVSTNSLGRPLFHIGATGGVGNLSKTIETVIVLDSGQSGVFQNAVVGCNGINMAANVTTSSYSSSGAASSGDNGHVTTIENDADVELASSADIHGDINATGDVTMASNSKARKNVNANGDISISGNARIYGDATAGESFSGNSNKVNGTITTNVGTPVTASACDPLGISDLMLDASNLSFDSHPAYGGENYNLSNNNTDTFTAGNYEFNELTANNNTEITIDGDVVFYIDGDFELKNNANIDFNSGATLKIYITGVFIMNSNSCGNCDSGAGGAANNFEIYSSASSSDANDVKIELNSGSDIYGSIYAPHAAMKLKSNTEINGAAISKWAELSSNSEVNYDEDLLTTGVAVNSGANVAVTKYYWQS